MELMQLEMFVAVVEERSFLRAAERVFRTQPAVSIGIRKLEDKLGVPLLDRASRGSARLTAAGERLYEYARKILGLRDEALSVVKEQEIPSAGTLHVGLVGEESLNVFPMLWKGFKERCPGVEVKIHSDTLSTVLRELSDQRLDLVLVSGLPRCDALRKSMLVTRLSQGPGHGRLWVVRQKLGTSPLSHAFERTVRELFSRSKRLSKGRAMDVPRLRVVR